MMRIKLIPLPTRVDPRGSLTFATSGEELPFVPRRVFFLFGLQAGVERGSHAHRVQEQFLVCVADSCTVIVDDGRERLTILLNSPTQALHVPPMHWMTVQPLSARTVISVLASDNYRESEYVHDYVEFQRLTRGA